MLNRFLIIVILKHHLMNLKYCRISLANFAKLLEQLDCLDALEQVIPETAPNPIDLLKLEGKPRQRVR